MDKESSDDIKREQAYETRYELHRDSALEELGDQVTSITDRIQVIDHKIGVLGPSYDDIIAKSELYIELEALNQSLYFYECIDGFDIEYDFNGEVKKIVCDTMGLTMQKGN